MVRPVAITTMSASSTAPDWSWIPLALKTDGRKKLERSLNSFFVIQYPCLWYYIPVSLRRNFGPRFATLSSSAMQGSGSWPSFLFGQKPSEPEKSRWWTISPANPETFASPCISCLVVISWRSSERFSIRVKPLMFKPLLSGHIIQPGFHFSSSRWILKYGGAKQPCTLLVRIRACLWTLIQAVAGLLAQDLSVRLDSNSFLEDKKERKISGLGDPSSSILRSLMAFDSSLSQKIIERVAEAVGMWHQVEFLKLLLGCRYIVRQKSRIELSAWVTSWIQQNSAHWLLCRLQV